MPGTTYISGAPTTDCGRNFLIEKGEYMSYALAILLQEQPDAGQVAAASGAATVIMVVYIALLLLGIVTMWKIFTKAGEPGWAAIIPIYNFIVLLKIAGKPAWWIILMLIPFVNIVILAIVCISLAKNFGKSAGYGWGLFLLGFIFGPMLAFGDARYQPQPQT